MASKKLVFSLRVEKEVLEKIGEYAALEQRSMNSYILLILLDHIRKRERMEKKEQRNERVRGFKKDHS